MNDRAESPLQIRMSRWQLLNTTMPPAQASRTLLLVQGRCCRQLPGTWTPSGLFSQANPLSELSQLCRFLLISGSRQPNRLVMERKDWSMSKWGGGAQGNP